MQGTVAAEERAVGFIPNVDVLEAYGQKQYAVFLTTYRAVFILKRVQALVVGQIGSDHEVSYANYNPNVLSANPKNITVPHSAVRKIHTKKTVMRRELYVEYVSPSGELRKLWADMRPVPLYVKQQGGRGVKQKDVLFSYAREAQNAYRNALPPEAASRGEWGF